MPSFSSLLTSLTGAGFMYEKSSRHASYNFNQEAQSLYRNQPRFPFEYYININLNNIGTARTYIQSFFNNPAWAQVMPLVKSIEMPSIKIETASMNQYNRNRLSQSKVKFEPIKVVFHDVADGKTLKFWEMYYRYYFGDGTEPGKNIAKQSQAGPQPYSFETLLHNITPAINPNILGLGTSVKNLFQSNAQQGQNSVTNDVGEKASLQNIVNNTLDNHKFGFNLESVQNIRNLIQTIEIYQVHAGRFNQVTLVNPRIVAFQHDTLNYATGDKTLELTFTIEYEYAYYTIQNLKLGGGETNNNSTIDQYNHGEFMELPALAFNATLLDFIESNNPLLNSDNPILQRIGGNVQSALGAVTGSFLSNNVVRRVTSSALDGLSKISPTPYFSNPAASIQPQSFLSSAVSKANGYLDVNRTGSS